MNKTNLAIIIIVAVIIGGLIGYAIGIFSGLDFCADTGLRILEKMDVHVNVSKTEILTKFQSHLDLLI